MKIPPIVCVAGCAVMLLAPASAEIIGIETFDYAGGAIAGAAGGTNWDWKNVSGSSMHTGVASDWTNVTGGAQVVNGRLVTDGNAVKREYNGANEAEGAVNGAAQHRQVYFRVEVRIDDHLSQTVGLSSYDFGDERIFFGVPFSAGVQKFGIEETGVGPSNSLMIANSPQIYTLVTKLDFDGDLLSMWVNPDLSQPETVTPATVTRAYTGTDWSTAVRLNSFAKTTWDNLVVATGWDDLKVIDPGAGQPLGAETRLGAGGVDDHDQYFYDYGRHIRLSNGNVVVSHVARDNSAATPPSADGDGYAAFFRIYTPDGLPVDAAPVAPYLDINPGGTGFQSRILLAPLAGGGFVATWNSNGGPGDLPIGSTGFSGLGDCWARVYAADGTAVSGSFKVNEIEPNSPVENDQYPQEILPLNGGGFTIVWGDDNDDTPGADGENDFFVRTFAANGTAAGASVQLGDAAHDAQFQDFGGFGIGSLQGGSAAALSDGGFVLCWTTRGSGTVGTPDGDSYGVFFQTFNANGTAESVVRFPYVDVNPGGIGQQSSPIVTALASGFAMAWSSFAAPGDVGGTNFGGGDAYLRVLDNSGVGTTTTAKVNDLTDQWNDRPAGMVTLAGGEFVIAWENGEDGGGPNQDDYFVRAYSAAGTALGASVQLGSAAVHGPLFQDFGDLIALADGGFATSWRTRDSNNNGTGTSADGAGFGAFVQAFNADGTDRSGVVIPYLDINPLGTGSQNSPQITPLVAGGFAATWNSAYGPGDVGAGGNSTSGGDTYTRLFDQDGVPTGATQRAHVGEPTGFDEQQVPKGIVESDGSYVVIFDDDNDNTDNKDDLFVRFFGLAAPASSGRGPILVTNTADSGPGSLRAAIENAPAGKGTINFDPSLSGQVIQLPGGELTTAGKTDLAIDASNLPDGITIDGFESGRVFLIAPGSSVSMHYLGITGGNVAAGSGGGIFINGGTLDLTHSTIWGNRAGFGAGIYSDTDLAGSQSTNLRRCTIANNTAGDIGGGVRNVDGLTRLISCTVAGNLATVDGGGGIATYGDGATRTEMFATIVRDNNGSDVEITPNGAASFQSNGSNIVGIGDALGEFVEPGDLTGTATPIALTSLGDFGGPTLTMHPHSASPAINPAQTFPRRSDQRGFAALDNSADIGAVEVGGYVSNNFTGGSGSLQQAITDSLPGGHITFDPVLSGGTISVPSGDFDISKKLHIDASSLPGGVKISGSGANRVFNLFGAGDLTLEKLTIADGASAPENGGGIIVNSTARLTMIDCTVRDCIAPCAGAITTDGAVILIRSTLSGNSASDAGGAICNGGSGVLSLRHSTISDNRATNFGGGIAFFSGTVNLENSIVAANSAPLGANITAPPSSQLGANILIGNPKLAPLGDYGGPTNTMIPLPGSAAIDMASGSTDFLDQRGRARDSNPDIGAAEFRGGVDLISIWETDFDQDGNNFGMEHALGTDPFVADTENPANPRVSFNAPGDAVIEFGYNPAAVAETVWVLERSYNLDPNNWDQVYFSENPDFGETTDFDILINAATSVELTDTTAPEPTRRAFYRFTARLDLP